MNGNNVIIHKSRGNIQQQRFPTFPDKEATNPIYSAGIHE